MVDYQFWYPGSSKVIKDYQYILDEKEGESVDIEPNTNKNSPKIVYLRIPIEDSNRNKNDMVSDINNAKDDEVILGKKAATPTLLSKTCF